MSSCMRISCFMRAVGLIRDHAQLKSRKPGEDVMGCHARGAFASITLSTSSSSLSSHVSECNQAKQVGKKWQKVAQAFAF